MNNRNKLLSFKNQIEKSLINRIKKFEYHKSHDWSDNIFHQCIQCGIFASHDLDAYIECEPSKMDNKFEYCCQCGNEYSRRDLIAGYIYCEKCR